MTLINNSRSFEIQLLWSEYALKSVHHLIIVVCVVNQNLYLKLLCVILLFELQQPSGKFHNHFSLPALSRVPHLARDVFNLSDHFSAIKQGFVPLPESVSIFV